MLQLASIIYGNNIQYKYPLSLIRELIYAILSLALTSLLNFLSWEYTVFVEAHILQGVQIVN